MVQQLGHSYGCAPAQVKHAESFIDNSGKKLYLQHVKNGIPHYATSPRKGSKPQVKQFSQPRQNKPDSYGSSRFNNSNVYKAPANDNFSRQIQSRQQPKANSYKLVPTGRRDIYGRPTYHRQPVYIAPKNQNIYRGQRVQNSRTNSSQKLSFKPIAGTNKLKLTLPAGRSVSLSSERNGGKEAGAKLVVKNETHLNMDGHRVPSYRRGHQNAPKNLEIIATPNRHKDYDYSVVHYEDGKKKEAKLSLPSARSPYNSKNLNARTYNLRSSSHNDYKSLTYGFKDSKDMNLKGRRADARDLTPVKIDIGPGEQVSYLSPKGQEGDSVNVTVGDTLYKATNKNDKQFAYIVYRKQPDGSRKTFYRTDARNDRDYSFDPESSFQSDISFEMIKKVDTQAIKDNDKKIQEEYEKAKDLEPLTNPFQDDQSMKEALGKAELISPNLDSAEIKDLKQAKNALRSELSALKEDISLTEAQSEKLEKLLNETSYPTNFSSAEKLKVIQEISTEIQGIKSEIDKAKSEDIKSKHDKHLEDQFDFDDLFGTDKAKKAELPKAVEILSKKTSLSGFESKEEKELVALKNKLHDKIYSDPKWDLAEAQDEKEKVLNLISKEELPESLKEQKQVLEGIELIVDGYLRHLGVETKKAPEKLDLSDTPIIRGGSIITDASQADLFPDNSFGESKSGLLMDDLFGDSELFKKSDILSDSALKYLENDGLEGEWKFDFKSQGLPDMWEGIDNSNSLGNPQLNDLNLSDPFGELKSNPLDGQNLFQDIPNLKLRTK